jgi:hypothetical protein
LAIAGLHVGTGSPALFPYCEAVRSCPDTPVPGEGPRGRGGRGGRDSRWHQLCRAFKESGNWGKVCVAGWGGTLAVSAVGLEPWCFSPWPGPKPNASGPASRERDTFALLRPGPHLAGSPVPARHAHASRAHLQGQVAKNCLSLPAGGRRQGGGLESFLLYQWAGGQLVSNEGQVESPTAHQSPTPAHVSSNAAGLWWSPSSVL